MKAVRSATPVRSVIVSPLLNLAATAPSGATLRHHRRIQPVGGSGISGTATLTLSPDRLVLHVRAAFDRACAATLRLRRLEGGRDAAAGALLILEIVPSGSTFERPVAEADFSLSDRQSFAALRADILAEAGICPAELRAGSVEGVRVAPAAAAEPARRDPEPYFTERMLVEIAAAERSATAVAARRHVELAILYARALHGASGAALASAAAAP